MSAENEGNQMVVLGFKLLHEDGTSLNGDFHYKLPDEPGEWGPWNEVPGNGCYVAVTAGVGLCADPRNADLLFLEVEAWEQVDVPVVPPGVRCFRIVRFRIPTQERLAEIATNRNFSEDIRTAATARLEDQFVLEQIAREDSDSDVRLAATKRLTDQPALACIAKEDVEWDVRLAATKRLTDQPALACIAREDRDWEVRHAATKRLTDQAVLAQIAREDRDWGVRHAATRRLTDQSVLECIAREDSDSDVRFAAIKRLEQLKKEI